MEYAIMACRHTCSQDSLRQRQSLVLFQDGQGRVQSARIWEAFLAWEAAPDDSGSRHGSPGRQLTLNPLPLS